MCYNVTKFKKQKIKNFLKKIEKLKKKKKTFKKKGVAHGRVGGG
jgi:hypothetical protein